MLLPGLMVLSAQIAQAGAGEGRTDAGSQQGEGCNLANPRLGRLFVLGPFAVRPVGALRSE
jgi:hypothetical protein